MGETIESIFDDLGGFGLAQWIIVTFIFYPFVAASWGMIQMAFAGKRSFVVEFSRRINRCMNVNILFERIERNTIGFYRKVCEENSRSNNANIRFVRIELKYNRSLSLSLQGYISF